MERPQTLWMGKPCLSMLDDVGAFVGSLGYVKSRESHCVRRPLQYVNAMCYAKV